MYDPLFNSVLVEIDDKDANWGSGNDDSMLGKSYRLGTVVQVGDAVPIATYPQTPTMADVEKFKGQQIMWNEGAEAGTTFDHDGKLYGFIYWWDVRGVVSA